jgi:hypothetical protein
MLRKEVLKKKQEALKKKKDYGFDNGLVEKIVLAHQFVLN